MSKFEFKFVGKGSLDVLNLNGDEGWRVVGQTEHNWLLERGKPPRYRIDVGLPPDMSVDALRETLDRDGSDIRQLFGRGVEVTAPSAGNEVVPTPEDVEAHDRMLESLRAAGLPIVDDLVVDGQPMGDLKGVSIANGYITVAAKSGQVYTGVYGLAVNAANELGDIAKALSDAGIRETEGSASDGRCVLVLTTRGRVSLLIEERDSLRDRLDSLLDQTATSVTVGSGLQVFGTGEAVRRVQTYILLDSTHPVERVDVRRSLARLLQEAEAEIDKLKGKAVDERFQIETINGHAHEVRIEVAAELERLRGVEALAKAQREKPVPAQAIDRAVVVARGHCGGMILRDRLKIILNDFTGYERVGDAQDPI